MRAPWKVRILVKNLKLNAEIFNTKTGNALAAQLPIEAEAEEWGDEFYFEVPVEMPLDETATTKVKIGDIGYWPPGKCTRGVFRTDPYQQRR